jgi:hypothetical protein
MDYEEAVKKVAENHTSKERINYPRTLADITGALGPFLDYIAKRHIKLSLHHALVDEGAWVCDMAWGNGVFSIYGEGIGRTARTAVSKARSAFNKDLTTQVLRARREQKKAKRAKKARR